MFWTPYVVAGLVFFAALASPRTGRGSAIAMRAILGVTLVGFGLPGLATVGFEGHNVEELVPLACAALLTATIVIPARGPEVMASRCGAVTGAISAIWFGALVADRDALFGATVSLGAAIAMAVGCLWWWLEARLRPTLDTR